LFHDVIASYKLARLVFSWNDNNAHAQKLFVVVLNGGTFALLSKFTAAYVSVRLRKPKFEGKVVGEAGCVVASVVVD
jgi:F0F1-type ATP synthase assembly protein I